VNVSHDDIMTLFVLALGLIFSFSANSKPKTDLIVFSNGDKLTGELQSLKRGRLSLSTEAIGSISIEWDKLSKVISNQQIQVETSDGIRYFGKLGPPNKDDLIVVLTDSGPQNLDMVRVISMNPIDGKGARGLDADLSVGYDFAKGGGVKHATLGLEMDYRSLIRIESLRFNTVITDSNSQDPSRRTNLGLQHIRLWSDRWFTTTNMSFDQNDELGVNLRSTIGMGVGRYLFQSHSALFSLEGGLQVSNENLKDENEDTRSLESTFTAKWDWFLFEDPELDWSTSLQVIPNLTERGRVRSELETTLSWEIIGDLKWAISIYGSWDNQPQSTGASVSDYGVNTNVVYEF
jgi:hypothetical protein